MTTILEEYPQLTDMLLSGHRVILFLGAGASRGANSHRDGRPCPLDEDLALDLLHHFKAQSLPSSNLGKVVDYLERSNFVDRSKINARIAEVFDEFRPHKPYESLFDIRWRGVFTTNFDTLIRQAYEATKDRAKGGQRLIEIMRYQTAVDYSDSSKLYTFFLHGSLSQYLDPTHHLVITERDKIRTQKNRLKMLEQLVSMQSSGTILFVGYSFSDEVFWETLNLLESIEGLSHSYALFPGISEPERDYLAQYRVTAIDSRFEEFMDELEALAKKQGARDSSPGQILSLGRKGRFTITDEIFSRVSKQFEVVTDNALAHHQPLPDAKQFYLGYDSHWSFYERNCDVIRGTTRELIEKVHKQLQRQPKRDTTGRANPVLLLSSTAGAGKSVMLRRTAYEIYMKGNPVLITRPTNLQGRAWDIDTLQVLSNSLDGSKILIIVDDCAGVYTDKGSKSTYGVTRDLVASLEAATIPAVILLAARTNEFFAFRDEELLRISTTQTTSVRSRDIKPIIRVDEHIEFDDQLEEEEVIELIGKLRQYRAIDPDLSEQVYIARINEGQRMLLMALYEVTDRQLRSFEEIIAEEFANLRDVNIEPEFENIDTTVEGRVPKEVWNHVRQQLGFPSLEPQISVIQRDSSEDTSTNNNLNLTQKAYLFAAITHRLGLRLPESCLRRLLQVRWDVFMEKIVNEYALRVLIREESEQQIYYQTRHPLIADTITQNLLGRDEQFQVVRQVVAKISYGNLAERYLLYRLLDSERMEELFTPYQRCDLYLQALRESGDDAFLLQHLGIIFMNELQDFEKASQYLEAARALQPENPSIMNSLAILAGKKGLWQLRQGSVIQAKQHYRSAERNFEQQLAIQPASEYGYHPYSYMLFQQAKEMGDEEEQEALLARALGVLDEGLTNVPLENQLALLELESQIINYTERAGIIERLRTLHREELEKSAHKAYLLSRHGLRQDRNRQDIEYLIDRAITHNPSSRSLIRQKVQLLTRFEPSKIKERVELLTMLFHMERRDLWVTRELLYLSFYVGDLALHRQCRQVLSSVLHPDKSVPRMVVDPLSQVPILYSGAIDEVDEFRQYAWIIREPFGDRIYVQPKKNPNIEFVPGQRVRFSVGINFMGAVAKDVEAI